MKKFIMLIYISLFIFIIIGCDISYDFSFSSSDFSIISYKDTQYKSIDGYNIENANKKIGNIKINNKTYFVYANPEDIELRYLVIRSNNFFNKKNFGLFVNEKYSLPNLKDVNEYKIIYSNKEYDYSILKYYYTDSNLDKLEAPYMQYNVKLKINNLDYVYYNLPVYAKNSNYYILNYQNKYVRLP